jgi:hypothetical protein
MPLKTLHKKFLQKDQKGTAILGVSRETCCHRLLYKYTRMPNGIDIDINQRVSQLTPFFKTSLF